MPKERASVRLFRQLQPRFRHLEIIPSGFKLDSISHREAKAGASTPFFLGLRFAGTAIELPLGIGAGHLYFDLDQSGLSFDVPLTFSKDAHGWIYQVEQHVWKILIDGEVAPLKHAALVLDYVLDDDRLVTSKLRGRLGFTGIVPETGLHLTKDDIVFYSEGWKAFIPEGPEHAAIETALELEAAQDKLRSGAEFDLVQQLKGRLADCIAELSSHPA